MVRSARSSMTKEDLERYQDWGHAVFDDIDYETLNDLEVIEFDE